MTISPMNNTYTDTPAKPVTITESDVRDFLAEKAREMHLRFGGYGSIYVHAMYFETGNSSADVSISAGNLSTTYGAPDFETALKRAEEAEAPEARLPLKEAQLSALQAEIEALKAKRSKENAA